MTDAGYGDRLMPPCYGNHANRHRKGLGMERLVDPLTTVDAKLWADEFMKVKARLGEQEFDHAMMLGWFANAIMQGYDEGQRRAKADAQATVEALQRARDQWKEAFERSCDDTAYLKAALDASGGEKIMNKISIRNATESQSLRIGRDNLSADDSWILVDVASARVTICNQRPGESPTGQVNLTRKQFNKMIDWYNRPQKIRMVTK